MQLLLYEFVHLSRLGQDLLIGTSILKSDKNNLTPQIATLN